jgi:hypothetical protein
MDAPEHDLDIKLQKISGDLIADFDRSLPRFLRKNDGAAGSSVRSRVRTRETDRLISQVSLSLGWTNSILDLKKKHRF